MPKPLLTVDSGARLGYRLLTAYIEPWDSEARFMAYQNQRWADMKKAHAWYKWKFRELALCIYCGEPATTKDHVFPLSLAAGLDLTRPNVRDQLLPHGLCLVKACNACNSLASNHPFTSIREKRRWIQERLRRKYHRKLHRPEWEEHELNELGHGLRAYVVKAEIDAKRIWRRVNWPTLRRRGSRRGRR